MGDRVVLARKGTSSMVKIRWTEQAPSSLSSTDDAEEMGAKWEGDELVTYDLGEFMEQMAFYESDDYMIDND